MPEYDVDPEPLLELFERKLMAGRMPSGFKETSADGFGIGKSRRNPLAVRLAATSAARLTTKKSRRIA